MKGERKSKTCEQEKSSACGEYRRRGFLTIYLFKNRVRFWPRTAEIEPLQFFDRVVGAKLAVDEIARHTPVPAVLANEPVQDVAYFGLHIGSSFLILKVSRPHDPRRYSAGRKCPEIRHCR